MERNTVASSKPICMPVYIKPKGFICLRFSTTSPSASVPSLFLFFFTEHEPSLRDIPLIIIIESLFYSLSVGKVFL